MSREKRVAMGIRMPESTKCKLEEAARAAGMSATQYAVKAIEAYIQAEQKRTEIYDNLQNGILEALTIVTNARANTIAEDIKKWQGTPEA